MRFLEFVSRFPDTSLPKYIKLRSKAYLKLESASEPSFSSTMGNTRMTLLEIRSVKSEGSFETTVTAALKHLHDSSWDDSQGSNATNDDVTQISTASEKDDMTIDTSSPSDVTDSQCSSEVEQYTSRCLPSLQVTTTNLDIPAPFRPPCSNPYDFHGYRASRFYEHLHLDDIEGEKPTQRSRSAPRDAIRFRSLPKAGQSRQSFWWLKRKESKHRRNKTF